MRDTREVEHAEETDIERDLGFLTLLDNRSIVLIMWNIFRSVREESMYQKFRKKFDLVFFNNINKNIIRVI